MRKKNRSYSVIIVPDAPQATNKEFLVSSKFLKNAIFSAAVLIIFFGFVIFDYLTISFDKEKMRRLEQENENIKAEKIQLSQKLTDLKKSLKKMEDFKEKILTAAGWKSPYALTEVGSGGGSLGNPGIDAPAITNNNFKENQPDTTILDKANEYTQNAKKIENTLKNVYNVINLQKVRLASVPSIWPTRGYITDAYGWRRHPFTGRRHFHNGLDIATQPGNKVYSPANGTVLVTEYRDYYGNMIIIDHGFGYTTWYAHLADFNVKEGQRVKRGQVIGFVGNTGRSTAPHLHYEVRVQNKHQNPMSFIID